jgi:hypothetical protein
VSYMSICCVTKAHHIVSRTVKIVCTSSVLVGQGYLYVYACSLGFDDFNLLLDSVYCRSYYVVHVTVLLLFVNFLQISFFLCFLSPTLHFYNTSGN